MTGNISCTCGGKLIKTQCEVEFYGIDFGVRECEVCTDCNIEYLDQETLGEVEKEVKKRGLFNLGQRVSITKSGNSLVVRLPKDITAFSGIKYKDSAMIYPSSRKKIELELC